MSRIQQNSSKQVEIHQTQSNNSTTKDHSENQTLKSHCVDFKPVCLITGPKKQGFHTQHPALGVEAEWGSCPLMFSPSPPWHEKWMDTIIKSITVSRLRIQRFGALNFTCLSNQLQHSMFPSILDSFRSHLAASSRQNILDLPQTTLHHKHEELTFAFLR